MIPLQPIVAGIAALAAAIGILRSFGPAYRVGRLIASTPVVPLADALAQADGTARYLGVRGRVDAADPFEDDAHRPLVLRRTRLAIRDGSAWRVVDERREAVAFEVREGLDGLAVQADALDDGLVVMPRQSVGIAGEVADRLPAGTPPDAQVRLRVEHVSAVDHAVVLGVPRRQPDGIVRMEPGLGRPLILTTLDRDSAIRVLADGGGRRTLAAAIAIAGGLVLLTLGVAWALVGAATGVAMAASPDPTGATGGDPRSSGQGPGLVGDPVAAIGLVLVIGALAALLTYAWVRATRAASHR